MGLTLVPESEMTSMEEQVDLFELTIIDICRRPTSRAALLSNYILLRDGARPDITQRLERLLALKILRPVPSLDRLDELSTDQLKAALRDKGSALTGLKPGLVDRLRGQITETEARGLVGDGERFQSTPDGVAILERAIQQEGRTHRQSIRESLERLRDLDIAGAWQSRVDYVSQRGGATAIVPTGFPSIGLMRRYRELRSFFQVWPESLEYLPLDMRAGLRIAVAMHFLWGEAAEVFLPGDFPVSVLPARIAVAHLASASRIAEEVHTSTYSSVSLKEGERYGSLSGACSLCIGCIGKQYKEKSEVPSFPLRGCTSESGCGLRVTSASEFQPDRIRPIPSSAPDLRQGLSTSPAFQGLLTPAQRLTEARSLADAGLISEIEYEQIRAAVVRDLLGPQPEPNS